MNRYINNLVIRSHSLSDLRQCKCVNNDISAGGSEQVNDHIELIIEQDEE